MSVLDASSSSFQLYGALFGDSKMLYYCNIHGKPQSQCIYRYLMSLAQISFEKQKTKLLEIFESCKQNYLKKQRNQRTQKTELTKPQFFVGFKADTFGRFLDQLVEDRSFFKKFFMVFAYNEGLKASSTRFTDYLWQLDRPHLEIPSAFTHSFGPFGRLLRKELLAIFAQEFPQFLKG